MHIISRKHLLEFAEVHPDSENALDNWYRLMKRTDYDSFVALRQTFPSADQVGTLTVFNIGGNKVRLIAAIHYNTHRIYIRQILTHAEYSKGKWKE
jgi:mRNA interferase HigB